MAEILLLNPRSRSRSRRKTRKGRRRNPSPAQLRARAAFAAASRARSRPRRAPVARAANPAPRRRRRRSAPVMATYRRSSRRRTNPISMTGIVQMLQGAAIQGAGAVAVDVAYAYVAKYLPANMQAGPGQVSLGSAVKAVLTAFAGKALSKHTRGLSIKAAQGALTVQARDIVAGLLPAGTVTNGLGFAVPAPVVNYSPRVGPTRTAMGAYTPGRPPLLSAYMAPGSSPVLSGARAREGAIR